MDPASPHFLLAIFQIIAIDVLLGGDNAVVIALACRNLPPRQRNLGIFWGIFGAIALRAALIFFAIALLAIPYLKLVGAALLLWIGVKLLQPGPATSEISPEGHRIKGSSSLLGAIRTIIVADAVMSLDNVVAIAGAAREDMRLVVFGLVVSVPIIVWGSKLILRLMDRFPSVIIGGAGLLGWIAGGMAASDLAVKHWLDTTLPALHWASAVAGALLVVGLGRLVYGKRAGRTVEVLIDGDDPPQH